MLAHLLAVSLLAATSSSPKAVSPKSTKAVKSTQSDVNVPLNSAPATAPHYYSADLSLPKLGTDRRVVLSEMRRVGLHMVNGEGSHLVFDGGPVGWKGVEKSTFSFEGMALDQVDIDFATPADDQGTRDLFLSLRQALAERNGLPWFDRVRDGDAHVASGVDALSLQSHQTSWANDGVKMTLAAAYGKQRSVRVSVVRDTHAEAAAELTSNATDDDRTWAAQDLTNLALVTRHAADSLFDDFGEQPAVLQAAKLKGKPITVRLAAVKIPKEIAGINEAVLNRRFAAFADGHWDVDAVDAKGKPADIELEVDVVPLSRSQPNVFAMRLSAKVANGKQKGETLYSAIQALR
jgi:hypothetical protein